MIPDWVHSPSASPVLFAWGYMVSLACPLASEGSCARFILEWDILGAEGGGSFVTMETDQAEGGSEQPESSWASWLVSHRTVTLKGHCSPAMTMHVHA